MMTNRVLIKYGDIAVGAKDEFSLEATEKEDFSDVNQIKVETQFQKYVNPIESYSAALDGESLPIPTDVDKAEIGWWSKQITDDYGNFENPIILTATAENLYSSIGITFKFDFVNNVFPRKIGISWYRGDILISQKDFYPNNFFYLCQNSVEYYNKIVVSFYSLNMPKSRLKVHSIEYGFGAEFEGDELQNVGIVQQISPISAEIPINTCEFLLKSKRNIEFSFQERQKVETYFYGRLRAKTFVKGFKRKSRNHWSVTTEDYIGIMDSVSFFGGIYENKNALELLGEIFSSAKVPYSVQEGCFESTYVSGYIPLVSCRDALKHVCFAIGASVDTSNRDDVYVYKLSNDVSQHVPLNRIMQGQSFEVGANVTAVELTAHSYKPIDDQRTLYEAEKSGVGNEILVRFSEPIHSLSVSSGEILDSGANYAIINAGSNCVLVGKKYEHSQATHRKTNPLVLTTDLENIISINDATLVSENNVDNLLEICYNYLVKTQKVNLKIIEARKKENDEIVYDGAVNIGDFIEAETEYMGDVVGHVIQQSYSLNGGIIVKDTVIR